MKAVISLLIVFGLAGAAQAAEQVIVLNEPHVVIEVAGSSVTSANPMPVTGTFSVGGSTVHVQNVTGSTMAVNAIQSGTWDEVGINDSGNSITVDGTVAATQSGAFVITGSTIGVTDAGGSLTVDNGGTFAVQAAQSGAFVITGTTIGVTDAGGSLTVDGTIQPGNTQNTTPWYVAFSTTNNADEVVYSTKTPNSTGAQVAKASAGRLTSYEIFNSNAANRWVKFYNSASAPTAGAGTIYKRVMVPAGGGAVFYHAAGIPFSAGIAFVTVTGAADSDATAVTANDLDINLTYK